MCIYILKLRYITGYGLVSMLYAKRSHDNASSGSGSGCMRMRILLETAAGVSSPVIKKRDGRFSSSQSADRQTPQSRGGTNSHAVYSAANFAVCTASCGGKLDGRKMLRIVVDPPSAGAFFAGSDVTGRVQIDTEEDKKFKYIHISLTGRAQVSCDRVFWHCIITALIHFIIAR